MIYPIVAYGDAVLKKETRDLVEGELDIKKLVADMFETMYEANGVGLAAPQIGMDIRLFVLDSTLMEDEGEEENGIKRAFINATILEESGEAWAYEEGCLSIPGVREDVVRYENLKLHYFDEDWKEYEEDFTGILARIIQHEYDHVDGVLFTDHLSGIKKRLLKNRLQNISRGRVDVDYRMKFPQ